MFSFKILNWMKTPNILHPWPFKANFYFLSNPCSTFPSRLVLFSWLRLFIAYARVHSCLCTYSCGKCICLVPVFLCYRSSRGPIFHRMWIVSLGQKENLVTVSFASGFSGWSVCLASWLPTTFISSKSRNSTEETITLYSHKYSAFHLEICVLT